MVQKILGFSNQMVEEAEVLGFERLFLNASASRLNNLLNFKDHLVIRGVPSRAGLNMSQKEERGE